MISTDLQGLRVLVTRPEPQADSLIAAIERAGGTAIAQPLITIAPLTDPDDLAVIRSRVQQLDRYDRVIFISANAARLGSDWIDRYWPQFPAGVQVLAIGPATRDALDLSGATVVTGPSGTDSEALLALPILENVAGRRVLIVRGRGGRELLAQTLRERGADVDYLELYARSPVVLTPGALDRLLADARIDAVVLTSGQILEAFLAALSEQRSRWRLLPLLLPSPRVADLAQQAGFQRVVTVSGAADSAIMAALATLVTGRSTPH